MIRRYRGLFAFLLAVIVSIGAGALPKASATVNGGPWDVGSYYYNTCDVMSSGTCADASNGFGPRGLTWMSVDSDDWTSYNDSAPEYFACFKVVMRTPGGTQYGAVAFKKTTVSSGGASWANAPDSGYLGAAYWGALFSGNGDITDVRVTNTSTCTSSNFTGTPSANTLPLRAYSGTTYSPTLATHIRNDGNTLRTTGSSPFWAVGDSASTNPPPIAITGGSITTYSIPTIAPSLQVSAGNGTWSATIGVNPSPSSPRSGETYTYDIDWGDGSTHAATNSAQHFYANSNTYTAVAKVTGVISNGDAYTDGTTTKVVTQNLTVCWAATCTPTTTTTVAPSGDNGTGSGNCDFWDVPCLLTKAFRALFFPSSSTLSGINHLWDSVTTKAPFSVLVEVVSFIPDNLADMSAAVVSPTAGVGTGCGTQPNINGRTITHFPCNDVTSGQPAHYTLSGNTNDTGGGGYTHSGTNYTGLFREIFLLIAGLLFIYATYRGCAEILK